MSTELTVIVILLAIANGPNAFDMIRAVIRRIRANRQPPFWLARPYRCPEYPTECPYGSSCGRVSVQKPKPKTKTP